MLTSMHGDGNYTCVLLRNLFKRLLKCNTVQESKKSCWISGRSDLRFCNKKAFGCIPSYFKGGIWGCYTPTNIRLISIYFICYLWRTAQLTVSLSFHTYSGGNTFTNAQRIIFAKIIPAFKRCQQKQGDYLFHEREKLPCYNAHPFFLILAFKKSWSRTT